MTPTKLLIGQIITVFAIVIGAVWFATQWAAGQLGYQPRLGPAWFELGPYPVYLPWRLFEWWYAYEAYAPTIFNTAGAMAAAGGVLGVVVAIIGSLWRARQNRQVTTYGSSRWASKTEVEKAGSLRCRAACSSDGPRKTATCVMTDRSMSCAFAPTRSGQGRRPRHPDVAVLDPFGGDSRHQGRELAAHQPDGAPERFSHCLLFNPTDPAGAPEYNPLMEVRRKGRNEVRDVSEHRRHPRGSRRQSLERRNALGEDLPLRSWSA